MSALPFFQGIVDRFFIVNCLYIKHEYVARRLRKIEMSAKKKLLRRRDSQNIEYQKSSEFWGQYT